jgi:hypothetical protein
MGPYKDPRYLLEEIVFLIGAFGRPKKADALGTILFFNGEEPAGRMVEGLLPGHRNEISVFADEGLGQPVPAVQKIVGKMPPDTEGGAVDGTAKTGWIDFYDLLIGHARKKRTAHSTEAAGRQGLPLRSPDITGDSGR